MNDMEEGKDYKDYLNPESLRVAEGALVEPSLAKAAPLDKFPVPAPRLFLRRHLDVAGEARLQPHRLAQGLVGQRAEETGIIPFTHKERRARKFRTRRSFVSFRKLSESAKIQLIGQKFKRLHAR